MRQSCDDDEQNPDDDDRGAAEARERLFSIEHASHDAVRPLISPQTINENIDMAERYGNCVTCGPVLETLLVRKTDGAMSFPNRSDAMMARAPQSFLLSELFSAHERALANGRHDFPDSCTLMGYYGYEITTLMDSGENIKITTPADLLVASV